MDLQPVKVGEMLTFILLLARNRVMINNYCKWAKLFMGKNATQWMLIEEKTYSFKFK